MVYLVTMASARKTAPKPMGRVASMVPAGRTPWRLCAWSGCYDSLGSIGTCSSLWSGVGVKRPGPSPHFPKDNFWPVSWGLVSDARKAQEESRRKGGKRLFSALFRHSRPLPLLSPEWPETAGKSFCPGAAFLATGWSDSAWRIRPFLGPKARGISN